METLENLASGYEKMGTFKNMTFGSDNCSIDIYRNKNGGALLVALCDGCDGCDEYDNYLRVSSNNYDEFIQRFEEYTSDYRAMVELYDCVTSSTPYDDTYGSPAINLYFMGEIEVEINDDRELINF